MSDTVIKFLEPLWVCTSNNVECVIAFKLHEFKYF